MHSNKNFVSLITIYFFIIFTGCGFLTDPESGRISLTVHGFVRNICTTEPVAGAFMRLNYYGKYAWWGDQTTFADESGYYQFSIEGPKNDVTYIRISATDTVAGLAEEVSLRPDDSRSGVYTMDISLYPQKTLMVCAHMDTLPGSEKIKSFNSISLFNMQANTGYTHNDSIGYFNVKAKYRYVITVSYLLYNKSNWLRDTVTVPCDQDTISRIYYY